MTTFPTAPVVVAGLVGGFATAKYSGRRELGGVVLAAAGAAATSQWLKKGPVVAGSLLGGYLFAFGASHPLAKKIGAWPAVFTVTAAAAGAAYAVADRH